MSVSASVATVYFNDYVFSKIIESGSKGYFDSRAFVLPKEEVCNYMIWRQQDCTRNSVQGLGQANFSHKEMNGLNNDQLQEKLFQERGVNWGKLDVWKKRGICVHKVINNLDNIPKTDMFVDWDIPVFTQDRNYVERWL